MVNEIAKYQPATLAKYQPTTLDEIVKLSELFAASGLFNADNARQSAAQLAVKILAGQELGFTPFAAANGMYIIKGKCAPGANLMAALVKASGRYNYRVIEMTDTKVSIEFTECGKVIGTSTFTAQDASKAGTQNMGKFPRNMLFARAISNGVKWFCPDISNGVAMYTPDELGATVDYETGEIIEVPANEVQAPAQQPNAIEAKPELEQVTEPTAEDLNNEHLNIEAGRIAVLFKNPKEAMSWAVENKYTDNEHSAYTRWAAIAKEQGGYKPDKLYEIAKEYVFHYFKKQAA